MHFAKEDSQANVIRAWEPGRLRVGERWFSGSLIVSPDTVIDDWRVASPGDLTLDQLEPALELDPDIVLIGTGTESVLPDLELVAALAERGMGLEIMTTAAACRTYNVLVHEHRRVVVALFNEA
jgi:uncharacterized protein